MIEDLRSFNDDDQASYPIYENYIAVYGVEWDNGFILRQEES